MNKPIGVGSTSQPAPPVGVGIPPPSPPIPTDVPAAPPVATWLCTFTVMVDFPSTMQTNDMEGAIAYAVTQYLNSLGMPSNCSVQLVATAGNASVADPTKSLHLEAVNTNIAGVTPREAL